MRLRRAARGIAPLAMLLLLSGGAVAQPVNSAPQAGLPPQSTQAWRVAQVPAMEQQAAQPLQPAQEAASAAPSSPSGDVLRVCADPNNLPQSNRRGEGYENKLAEALARGLGRKVEYYYFPQRMGFVRNTLRLRDDATQTFKCDIIMGVPKGYELTATTQPYMRSTYALVVPANTELTSLKNPDDLLKLPPARLKTLRIGAFARSPGADWLLRNNLLEQATFYAQQSGDPDETPATIVEQGFKDKRIDVAIVWGPVAGYLASRHHDGSSWHIAPFAHDADIHFDYEIAMGVRFGEAEWKKTLDDWIATHPDDIKSILTAYQIPLL